MKLAHALLLGALASLAVPGCQGGGPAPKEKPKLDAKAIEAAHLKELKIEDLKVGTGETAAAGDSLTVKYEGKLLDGTVFDSSEKQGRNLTFALGKGAVIPGWDEGLVGMKVGGKRKLSVPYEKAYGRSGNEVIPPKSDLYFEIELVGLLKKGKETTVTTKVIKAGSGPAAAKGSTVTIHYVGKLTDGTVFESTREKKKTYTFKIGADVTMSGLEYGVIGMKKGAVWELTIPPKVGAQQLGMPIVPHDATIVMTVEMLDVK